MIRTRVDPIDGPERYCRRCDYWWPDDGEFWYYARRDAGAVAVAGGRTYTRRLSGQYSICKACHQERTRLTWERNRERYCARRRERYATTRRSRAADHSDGMLTRAADAQPTIAA